MADKKINFKFGGSSDELDKMLTRVQRGFGDLEKVAGMVGGAFAFEKIREGFMSFVRESDNADLAAQKLGITLSSSGNAGAADSILDLADALEQVTTYEADATVEAAAMMARFKLTGDQIKTMIPAAQDMAAVLGKDLVSASDAMARAVHVGAQGLRALDMGFTASERAAFELADTQGRVDIIARRANATFAGGAAAMAGTATGAATQYANALQNLQQSIGGVLQQPVAAAFRTMTDTVREVTAAFEGLSPTTRGVMVAMGAGVAGVGAIAAGFVAVAAAASALVPVFGPVIVGFAAVMNAEISLAAVTGGLKAAFTAVRTAAVTAWGGVLAPLLAIGAAVLGVTLAIGSMSRNWDDLKFNARAAVFAIRDWFNGMVEGLVTGWAGFVDGIVEKVSLIKSMLSGMSPEAAGDAARKAVAESGGAAMLEKVKAAIAEVSAKISGATAPAIAGISGALGMAFEVGGEMLSAAADDFRKDFGAGVEVLVAGAKRVGLDFEAMGTKAPKPNAPGAGGGGGGGIDDFAGLASLKDVFSGIDSGALKQAEGKVAANLVAAFGGGNAGLAAASKYLRNVETMSGLSEATLTTILTRTTAGVGSLSTIAGELRGLSDSTVQSLLAASNYSIRAVRSLAPAIAGLTDAAVATLLKAAGGSLSAVGEVAPHVRKLGDTAIKSFVDAHGSLKGLATMGDQFNAVGPAMATAAASTDAYWRSVDGQAQLLGAKAAGAGIQLASGMGAVGGVFSGVMAAMSKGDMMGAAMAGISGIVTQSKSFQAISTMINEMFTSFAQALNPLFDGLAPILMLVGTLLASVGGAIKAIFEGIQPIFALISGILAPVFTVVNSIFGGLKSVFQAIFAPIMPLVRGLMPVFTMIGTLFSALAPILMNLFLKTSPLMIALQIVSALFQALEPVFKVVNQAIGGFINLVLSVFKSLAGVWNNIVAFVANVAQQLISIVPGMADAAKKFGDSIRGAAINIGELDVAMQQVTVTANTTADVTFPDLAASMDEAGGSASAAGEEMGNMPSGFKINLAQFEASTALGVEAMQAFLSLTSGRQGEPGGGVPTVVAGSLPSVASAQGGGPGGDNGGGGAPAGVTIYVNNPDPAALAASVKSHLDAINLQSTGNPNAGGRSFATPATGSGFK